MQHINTLAVCTVPGQPPALCATLGAEHRLWTYMPHPLLRHTESAHYIPVIGASSTSATQPDKSRENCKVVIFSSVRLSLQVNIARQKTGHKE